MEKLQNMHLATSTVISEMTYFVSVKGKDLYSLSQYSRLTYPQQNLSTEQKPVQTTVAQLPKHSRNTGWRTKNVPNFGAEL